MKHPHAEILKVIAEDGEAEIEILSSKLIWETCGKWNLFTNPDSSFRIKPIPAPKVVRYQWAYTLSNDSSQWAITTYLYKDEGEFRRVSGYKGIYVKRLDYTATEFPK